MSVGESIKTVADLWWPPGPVAVGTIVTIWSTIIAAKKADASKKSSSEAERFSKAAESFSKKAEKLISEKHRISEMSALVGKWEFLYNKLAPFGPSAAIGDIQGRNSSRAARMAQDYLECVNSNKQSLSTIPDFDERFKVANDLLSEFSDANGPTELKDLGCALYNKLSDLNASIRSVLTEEMHRLK